MYEMGTVAGSMAPVMGEGAGSKWYVTHELRTGDADRVAGPFADQQQAQAWMNDNLPMHLDDEGQYGTSEVVEGHDDPMNSNSAITGAYYESKESDALLARIKSLALIK